MNELSRQTRNRLLANVPESLTRRRPTLLLGFLGRFFGPAAGLLTYDDGQQIENEINHLNRVVSDLSHSVGSQIHVN